MTALNLRPLEDKAARFIGSNYSPLTAKPVTVDAPRLFLAIAQRDPLMARGKTIELIDAWRASKRPVKRCSMS